MKNVMLVTGPQASGKTSLVAEKTKGLNVLNIHGRLLPPSHYNSDLILRPEAIVIDEFDPNHHRNLEHLKLWIQLDTVNIGRPNSNEVEQFSLPDIYVISQFEIDLSILEGNAENLTKLELIP